LASSASVLRISSGSSWAVVAAAQDDVHVLIAEGGDDRGAPLVVYADEIVGMQCCVHGIDSDLQVAVGTVLETDREGQAAGHFAMGLDSVVRAPMAPN